MKEYMNRIMAVLKKIRLEKIVTVLLAGIMLWAIAACNNVEVEKSSGPEEVISVPEVIETTQDEAKSDTSPEVSDVTSESEEAASVSEESDVASEEEEAASET